MSANPLADKLASLAILATYPVDLLAKLATLPQESLVNFVNSQPDPSAQEPVPEIPDWDNTTTNLPGLEPPPERSFANRQLLLQFVRQHAFARGYATAIARSSPARNVYLQCTKSGQYADRVQAEDGIRQRRTSSKRQGCPFSLYGHRLKDGTWALKVKNGSHNHEPNFDLSAFPSARTFSSSQLQIISDLSAVDTPPRQILNILRQQSPNQPFSIRDIYNVRAKMRRVNEHGETSFDNLPPTLDENEIPNGVSMDQSMVDQPMNQPMNQPLNQPLNQSTVQGI